MALIKTPTIENDPINEILKEAGIVKKGEGNGLRELLENRGLGLDDVITEMSATLRTTTDESVKLKIFDSALKMHRVMEDPDTKNTPVVINIQAENGSNVQVGGATIPSICLPREIAS